MFTKNPHYLTHSSAKHLRRVGREPPFVGCFFHQCTIPFACFASCVVLSPSSEIAAATVVTQNKKEIIRDVGISTTISGRFRCSPLKCKQTLKTESMINHNNGRKENSDIHITQENTEDEKSCWKKTETETRVVLLILSWSKFGSNLWFRWNLTLPRT